MSGIVRRRAHCNACGALCRATPLELMIRGGNGYQRHWLWWQVVLCAPCQVGLHSQIGTPQLHELESGE